MMDHTDIADGYMALFSRNGATSIDSVLRLCESGAPLSVGTISTVWRIEMEGIGFYIKRYRYAHPRLRYWFHPTRARNEVRSASRLRALGFRTPDMAACFEHYIKGRFVQSLLMIRDVPQSPNLQRLLSSTQLADGERNAVLDSLGHAAAQLHNARFFHRDLKLRNVLCSLAIGEEHLGLTFIDCPRGRRWLWVSEHQAIKDLTSIYKHARVACSVREWEQLETAYIDTRGLKGAKASRFVRKLHQTIAAKFPESALPPAGRAVQGAG